VEASPLTETLSTQDTQCSDWGWQLVGQRGPDTPLAFEYFTV